MFQRARVSLVESLLIDVGEVGAERLKEVVPLTVTEESHMAPRDVLVFLVHADVAVRMAADHDGLIYHVVIGGVGERD